MTKGPDVCASTPLSASLLSIWSWNRSSRFVFVFFQLPRVRIPSFSFQFILFVWWEFSYTLFLNRTPSSYTRTPSFVARTPSLKCLLIVYHPTKLTHRRPRWQFNTLCLVPPIIPSSFSFSPLHDFSTSLKSPSPPLPLLVFRCHGTPPPI